MLGPGDGGRQPVLPAEWWGPMAHAVFGQDSAGLVALDAQLRVLATNVVPAEFPRLAAVEVGTRVAELLEALGVPDLYPMVERVLRAERGTVDRAYSVKGRGVDGGPLYLRCAALRIDAAEGPPLGVLLTLTDVTDMVRAQFKADIMRTAAATLGTSLDVVETAQQLADLMVPALADVATVHLADAVLTGDEPGYMRGGGEPHSRRVAMAYAGTSPPQLLGIGDPLPPLPDVPEVRRLQSGQTVLLAELDLDREDVDPAFLRATVPEGAHSLVTGALFARGLVLGGVQLWRTERAEAFDEEDARLLDEIASRTALSVDNARRYTREHGVSLALQRSLLPEARVDVMAAETFGAYVPTASSAGVGGDWYDVIPLSSLRMAFVVGDVVGHGLTASATMGRLRTAVQTLADMDLSPDELLTHVDDLIVRLAFDEAADDASVTGATCLYVEYDPVTSRCRMASAGHPPPAVVGPDGRARYVDLEVGPPLGIGGMPFEVTEIDVAPGSLLALYSDGLVEGADRDIEAGMGRLLDRLEKSRYEQRDLEGIGQSVMESAAEHTAADDVTLLLARVRSVPEEDSATWQLPADPAYVSRARDMAAERLAQWGMDELAFTAELVVSELVTNAIRYGGGPLTLRLIRGGVLVCEVSDPSNTQPRLRRAKTTDEGGRGLFLVAQLSSRWGSRYQQSGKTIWAELQPVATAFDFDAAEL